LIVIVGCVPPPQPASPAYAATSGPRNVTINGAPLDERTGATLAQLEAAGGVTLPDGNYWYDAVSGAFGVWGQPANAFIGAGHELGPPVPENASGGTSGVYINGRRLQDREVQFLSALVAYPWQPGRYFIDATGNAGVEGGPVIVNIMVRARQVHGGSSQGGGGTNGDGTTTFQMGSGQNAGSFFSDGTCRYYQDAKGNVISSGC